MNAPGLAVLMVSFAALSGCVPGPSAEPVAPIGGVVGPEPGDDEALVREVLSEGFYSQAAGFARTVIENYLATSDAITAGGGVEPRRMESVVTPAWFPTEDEGFAHYRNTGERTVGDSVVESLIVQLARKTPEGILDIGVITCIDTTGVLVIGPDDADPPESVRDWLVSKESYGGEASDWEDIEVYFQETSARGGDRRAIVFWLVGPSLDTLRIDHSEQWWGVTQCR